MENAVDDDAVELFVIVLSELLGVGTDGVERYDDVAADYSRFVVVEGDDIGLVVVAEVFVVHFEYFLVVNEHVAHFTHLVAVGCCDGTNPCRSVALPYFRHLYAVGVVCNHI